MARRGLAAQARREELQREELELLQKKQAQELAAVDARLFGELQKVARASARMTIEAEAGIVDYLEGPIRESIRADLDDAGNMQVRVLDEHGEVRRSPADPERFMTVTEKLTEMRKDPRWVGAFRGAPGSAPSPDDAAMTDLRAAMP